MQKTLIAVIVVLALALTGSVAYIVVDIAGVEQQEASNEKNEEKQEEGNSSMGRVIYPTAPIAGTSPSFYIEVKSARLEKTVEGVGAVIVKFAITNIGDTARSLNYDSDLTVYQNGISLEDAWSSDLPAGDPYEDGCDWNDVRPGATYEFEMAYILRDNTSDVEVEISKGYGNDEVYVFGSFSLK